MPKKKRKKYSRFNPAYLASRHAGPLFMFLALGLLCGMAYRALVQPNRYAARTEVAVRVVPPEAAGSFDWEEKGREWNGWLKNRRDWGLLCVNLRLAVKLAATQDEFIDTQPLSEKLADFSPVNDFSASLFPNRLLGRIGPVLRVTRRDIASYMDFQSLATIIADLDPPREVGSAGWDFTFFHTRPHERDAGGIISKPGPDDRFFQVFFRLHESLRGQPVDSPYVAWRTAVDELATRLDREAQFAGGGGFGATARREIIREITTIPALAANGLYHVNGWFMAESDFNDRASAWSEHWGRGTTVDLRPVSGSEGRIAVSSTMPLNPIAYRRDTPYTRLPPLAVATLVSFLAAREDKGAPGPLETAIVPQPAYVEASADFVAELEPMEPEVETTVEAVEVTYREVIDEVAAKQRLSLIAMHEESATMARVQRDAAFRRLNAARDAENRLSNEAVAARVRADRLQERYDAASAAAEADNKPDVPPATAKLFAQRDEVFARLTTLLQYCTEEHPFVRQARRELDACEAQLAQHSPDEEANRAAEARATRLANLYLEWETAVDQADTLEERLRRQSEEAVCLLDEVTDLERCISQRELELAQAKESPVPIIRQEVPVVRKVKRVAPPVVQAVEKPRPAPVPAVSVAAAHLEFSPLPLRIPLEKTPPGWRALLWGLLCGLCLGLLWMLLRELFANRFRNAAEARRMVRLPVLASLPAYDMRSFRAAAGSMKGELLRTRAGRYQFIPTLVEYSEPPAEARRGRIVPVARRPRFLAWVFALLFLILAGLLYYRSLTGFFQPGTPDELPLPGSTIPAWIEEGEEWGDLP